jgi:hypothetical protein
MNREDLQILQEAVGRLENPSWAMRITNIIGIPVEFALMSLPRFLGRLITRATGRAIKQALFTAVSTMDDAPHPPASRGKHQVAVSLSGGLGGFFGWVGLIFELPVSTVIMLRSIADIARSEGENIRTPDALLACVQVFALGSPRKSDNAAETAYYAVRIALARAVAEAAQYVVEKGLAEEGAPVLVRLIAILAGRFGVIASEKAAAEFVPVLGAVGGAAINILFIRHFQSMARGHFIVRRLERKYGSEEVKRQYEKIARKM